MNEFIFTSIIYTINSYRLNIQKGISMYLINIALNPEKTKTQKAFQNPNIFHGILESSYEEENNQRKRKLWTLLNSSSGTSLVILSSTQPNVGHIISQVGYSNNPDAFLIRDYTPFLSRIKSGDTYHFVLTAFPTKAYSNHDGGQTRGTRKALQKAEEQVEWLKHQGERLGFLVNDVKIVKQQQFFFKKPTNNTVNVGCVTFTGSLTVTDRDLFEEALTTGIGRGKCYGNGLMLIS